MTGTRMICRECRMKISCCQISRSVRRVARRAWACGKQVGEEVSQRRLVTVVGCHLLLIPETGETYRNHNRERRDRLRCQTRAAQQTYQEAEACCCLDAFARKHGLRLTRAEKGVLPVREVGESLAVIAANEMQSIADVRWFGAHMLDMREPRPRQRQVRMTIGETRSGLPVLGRRVCHSSGNLHSDSVSSAG